MNVCITVHDLMDCTNLVEAMQPVSNAIREWVYSTSHEALKLKTKVHDVITVAAI